MTWLVREGFELGDTGVLSYVGGGSISSSIKRSGGYSLKGNASDPPRITLGAEYGTVYVRAPFYADVIGSSEYYMLRAADSLASLSGFSVRYDVPGQQFELCRGTVQVAQGAYPLVADKWYLLELYWYVANAPSGAATLKIDGAPIITATGIDTLGVDTYDVRFYDLDGAGNTYWDDFAVRDDGWCGDGRIVLLSPNAAGDNTGLSPSAGANYQCVDDVPPNDDTDYVYDNVTTEYDLYNLVASSLPSGATVSSVWPVGKARKVDTPALDMQLGIKPSGGSESWCATIGLTTDYQIKQGDYYDTNPVDAEAWESADLDALQVGVKVI